jgi:hypothetical protein
MKPNTRRMTWQRNEKPLLLVSRPWKSKSGKASLRRKRKRRERRPPWLRLRRRKRN